MSNSYDTDKVMGVYKMKKKKKFRQRRRRTNRPQPIGQIIAENFPELLPPDFKTIHYRKIGIVSFQSEKGFPSKLIQILLGVSGKSNTNQYNTYIRGL